MHQCPFWSNSETFLVLKCQNLSSNNSRLTKAFHSDASEMLTPGCTSAFYCYNFSVKANDPWLLLEGDFYRRLYCLFCLGGRVQAVGDERCTHLVVEENSIKELPFTPSKRLYVVKQEVWTWLTASQAHTQKRTHWASCGSLIIVFKNNTVLFYTASSLFSVI